MFEQSSSKRKLRLASVLAVLGVGAAAALASAPALAWHHGYWGPRVGVYVGPGYYYPPPYYYSPPVVVQPAAPPVYIEQQQQQAPMAAPAPAQPSMWYYCAASRSYYPYVKDCPGGWQQVAPRPAP